MEEKKLLYFISKKLVLDTSASVINNAQTNLRNFSFMVDAIVKNGKETIYVDIKKRRSRNDIDSAMAIHIEMKNPEYPLPNGKEGN